MDTLYKRKAMMSLRARLAAKRSTPAPRTPAPAPAPADAIPNVPVARPRSSGGCSSCGQKISLDPEDAKARLKERVRVARATKGNYRSMGLATMEPQHRR